MALVKDERTIDAKFKISETPIRAKGLTITGNVEVTIPGTDKPYAGDRVEISHYATMKVLVAGSQTREGKDILLQEGTVIAEGYRTNPARNALQSSQPVSIIKDPHVVVYRGGEVIRMPQVTGVPSVKVVDGRVNYRE